MMDQFYTHTIANIVYLCLRDADHPWYGTTIKRLYK